MGKIISLSRLGPVSGIYKISNTKTGRVYIGQSANIALRWANHVDGLAKGRHFNKVLSEDFQEYGLRSFAAEIIEKCKNDKAFLLERERHYIALYFRLGYNLYNNIDDRSGTGRLFVFAENGGEKMYDF
jgi:group I intron endonuclease